jgi:hypothetical protein
VTGLLAHYYLRELRKLWAGVRTTIVLLRAPLAARRLLAMRASLICEIEAVRSEVRLRDLAGGTPALPGVAVASSFPLASSRGKTGLH